MTYSFLSLGCQVLHVDNGVVFINLNCYLVISLAQFLFWMPNTQIVFLKYIKDKNAPQHRFSFFYKLEQTLAWLLIELLNFNYTCMHKYIYKVVILVCTNIYTKLLYLYAQIHIQNCMHTCTYKEMCVCTLASGAYNCGNVNWSMLPFRCFLRIFSHFVDASPIHSNICKDFLYLCLLFLGLVFNICPTIFVGFLWIGWKNTIEKSNV